MDKYLDWYKKSVNKLNKTGAFKIPDHQPIEIQQILNDNFFG